MLDTSGSMTLELDLVKRAAEEFLMRMLPEDQGKVGAFNDKIQFLPDGEFTSNRDQLIRSSRTSTSDTPRGCTTRSIRAWRS